MYKLLVMTLVIVMSGCTIIISSDHANVSQPTTMIGDKVND